MLTPPPFPALFHAGKQHAHCERRALRYAGQVSGVRRPDCAGGQRRIMYAERADVQVCTPLLGRWEVKCGLASALGGENAASRCPSPDAHVARPSAYCTSIGRAESDDGVYLLSRVAKKMAAWRGNRRRSALFVSCKVVCCALLAGTSDERFKTHTAHARKTCLKPRGIPLGNGNEQFWGSTQP